MVQDIKQIELHAAVQAAGKKVEEGDDIISERNYILNRPALRWWWLTWSGPC